MMSEAPTFNIESQIVFYVSLLPAETSALYGSFLKAKIDLDIPNTCGFMRSGAVSAALSQWPSPLFYAQAASLSLVGEENVQIRAAIADSLLLLIGLYPNLGPLILSQEGLILEDVLTAMNQASSRITQAIKALYLQELIARNPQLLTSPQEPIALAEGEEIILEGPHNLLSAPRRLYIPRALSDGKS